MRVVRDLDITIAEPVAHESLDFATAIEIHLEITGTFAAVKFEEALCVTAVLQLVHHARAQSVAVHDHGIGRVFIAELDLDLSAAGPSGSGRAEHV